MNLVPISEVSKEYGVSTRTLRYYEQIGLLSSGSKENYAYRVYNDEQLERLQQIIILRKLRLSLKQIIQIFENGEISKTLAILTQNMRETDDEINYLKNIRNALNFLIEKLRTDKMLKSNLKLLDDSGALDIIDSLPSKKSLKENKKMNENPDDAKDITNPAPPKLRDVRIVYLPPATVASYQYEGDEPENKVHIVINDFVRSSNLAKIKPDMRQYGFNAPNPVDETNAHGYEMWVTIPDDFPVPAPLQKKKFEGGLYAAHMIELGAFEEWGMLWQWAENHEKYTLDLKGGGEIMHGLLEEQLNFINRIDVPVGKGQEGMQLDLLLPIIERTELVKRFENLLEASGKAVKELYAKLDALIRECAPDVKSEVIAGGKARIYYVRDNGEEYMTISLKDEGYIRVGTKAMGKHRDSFKDFEFDANNILKIKGGKLINTEIFKVLIAESLTGEAK